MEDGTQIALPAKEEESNTADESIPELQLEPLQGTEDAQIDDAPGEHPTGDADNIPNEDPYHTSEGELSLVPAALEEHDVQQQIARDATIAAAIAAQPNTRYTLRAQSRSTVTPSPSKPPPPRPTPWKTTPQKTTPRTKREVAQRKKPKCR